MVDHFRQHEDEVWVLEDATILLWRYYPEEIAGELGSS